MPNPQDSPGAEPGVALRPLRVLLVMPDHRERALLRAELRERGYDALGAPDPGAALVYRPHDAERGPVGLLVLDQRAAGDAEALAALRARHGHPPVILIASATLPVPPGDWSAILSRPVTIGQVADKLTDLLRAGGEGGEGG